MFTRKIGKKAATFRTLLIFETALAFLISLFFVSCRFTGLVVNETLKNKSNTMFVYFFILGFLGLATLIYLKKKE